MDAVASATTARSIQAINDVLKTANAETIDAAKKMVKVTNEVKLSSPSGKSSAIDCLA
jgi:hypothetical protein